MMLLISYLDQVLVGNYCIEVVAVRPVPVLQICFGIGKKKLINVCACAVVEHTPTTIIARILYIVL